MAIWNTFRKNSFKFGYEGHLVLTVYLKKYLMGKWLRGPDLNRRPSGYEPDELPRLLHPAPETWHILLFLSKKTQILLGFGTEDGT